MFVIRRSFVGFCAIALVIIGIVSIARAHSVGAGTVRYVAAALNIAVALYGLYGVMYMNYRHLLTFTFFLAVIWLYLIANMVVSIVDLHPLDAIEDILLAGITFFCGCVAASLTHATRELAEHDKDVVRSATGSSAASDPALNII